MVLVFYRTVVLLLLFVICHGNLLFFFSKATLILSLGFDWASAKLPSFGGYSYVIFPIILVPSSAAMSNTMNNVHSPLFLGAATRMIRCSNIATNLPLN